jgi:FAD/FMN-containing dehydrogenase
MEITILDRELRGRAVLPGADGWDEARAAWNLRADQRPAVVVFAEDVDDIVAAVGFARDNGLPVAPQGSGHGARPGTAEGAVLLRTDRMRHVDVDAGARVARVEAGVIARELGAATSPHGLSAFPGSSADVGVVGYTLGGGLGWLSRRHGLACNHVRAVEVVTTDGQRRRVDADNEPELFWALRGGGGSFAVVSAIEVDLVDLPEVYAGAVIHPAGERSGDILRGYAEWAAGTPDEVTSLVRFLHPPPLPAVPEPLRDRHLIMIVACHSGPASEGAELMAPLTRLGDAVVDSFQAMPAAQLVTVAMDPEQPAPSISDTTSLTELPDEAIDAFVATAGPEAGSPLVSAELRQLGGALSIPDGAGAARSHLEAAWIFTGTGVPRDPALGMAINEQIDTIRDAFSPWSSGTHFPNFAGRPTAADLLFDAPILDRLRDVKRRYDPDGLLQANLPIT